MLLIRKIASGPRFLVQLPLYRCWYEMVQFKFYLGVSVFLFLVEFTAESRQLKRYFSNEIPTGLKNIKEITQDKY